jgi:hypothetical protein
LRKQKKGSSVFVEKDSVRRRREKLKLQKEIERRRRNHESRKATERAKFRLRPFLPRPDAVPFGTAMQLLRGMAVKQEIFVRSVTNRWKGETKVVAQIRVVPNAHSVKPLKGIVQFPYPVVFKKKDKSERIAVIVGDKDLENAKKAGMIPKGKEYIEEVCYILQVID